MLLNLKASPALSNCNWLSGEGSKPRPAISLDFSIPKGAIGSSG